MASPGLKAFLRDISRRCCRYQEGGGGGEAESGDLAYGIGPGTRNAPYPNKFLYKTELTITCWRYTTHAIEDTQRPMYFRYSC